MVLTVVAVGGLVGLGVASVARPPGGGGQPGPVDAVHGAPATGGVRAARRHLPAELARARDEPGAGLRTPPAGHERERALEAQPPRARRLGQPRPAHPAGRACGPWPRRWRTSVVADRGDRAAATTARSALEVGPAGRDGGRPVRAVPHPRGRAAPVPAAGRSRRPGRRALAGVEPLARAKGVRLAGEADVLPGPGRRGGARPGAAQPGRQRDPAHPGGRHGVGFARRVERGRSPACRSPTPAAASRKTTCPACSTWRSAARRPGPRHRGGGAGLGLAIARGIIEAHQGVIDVVNAGPGCRFEIRLPLSVPEGPRAVMSR